jgi:phage-related protein
MEVQNTIVQLRKKCEKNKRSISGTHKVVSKKHLQEYLDAFVFLRNNRDNDKARFFSLLGIVLQS